jgi:hypothetical protein
VMRAQQHAAVWPRLTTALETETDSTLLTLTVRNAGVGPAQLVWAQATFDGAPVDSWTALLRRAVAAVGASEARGGAEYHTLTNTVLTPGEQTVALRLTGAPASVVYRVAGRVGLRLCYCSVFDRCWRLDAPNVAAAVSFERPAPVAACDRPAAPLL